MKKILLLFTLIIALAKPVTAQINLAEYSQSTVTGTMDKPQNVGLITCEKEINNSFWVNGSNAGLEAWLSKDTAFTNNRPPAYTAITTFDTSKAHFFLHGVNRINAADYEFRVMTNDGKLISPWGGITKFSDYAVQRQLSMPGMAYLGGYSADLGIRIIVDVRNKSSNKIIATSVVAWEPIRPIISQIYLPGEFNFFLKRLEHPWTYRQTDEELHKWSKQYQVGQVDPATYLPKKLVVEPADNNLVFYLSVDIYKKEQLEYELTKNDDVIVKWKYNDFDNNFIWLKNLTHGQYQLKIRYTAQRQNLTIYPFEVKTPWYQSNWFKAVAGILICAFAGLILSLLVNLAKKKEAERELAKKTKLQLELKSIYAQLNPHFIFNALSSIQGLINKQDIKGANTYLSDFARLMRESLNNSNKDQTSLDKEMAALDTYLKLEQLRFGFKYQISVDKSINAYDTEIPSLLLQPLVENSVKHGVSALQDKGLVTINFSRLQNNMVVNITDNGGGFLTHANATGFGLKLTKDRIKLLNEFNKGQAITFEIKNNTPSGANIELIFNNWFL